MGSRYTSDVVKDGGYSFAFSVLFTLTLLLSSPISERVAHVSVWLLGFPAYLVFWRPWFGLDCANADAISDKLKCAGAMLALSVLFYWMIGFALLSLSRRLWKSQTVEREIWG